MVEGPIEKVTRKEMAIAVKPGQAAGPSEVCAEMVLPVEIDVMIDFANVY